VRITYDNSTAIIFDRGSNVSAIDVNIHSHRLILAAQDTIDTQWHSIEQTSEIAYNHQHPTAPHQLNRTNLLPAPKPLISKKRVASCRPSKKSHH
jgi:hypothetical protein